MSRNVNTVKCLYDVISHIDTPNLESLSYHRARVTVHHLVSAALVGIEPMVRYLVDSGFNNRDGLSNALITAAHSGNESIVRYLVRMGADIHHCDDQAFRFAVYGVHENIVRYLASVGANIHAMNHDALITATYFNDDSMLSCLILLGANVEYVLANWTNERILNRIRRLL